MRRMLLIAILAFGATMLPAVGNAGTIADGRSADANSRLAAGDSVVVGDTDCNKVVTGADALQDLRLTVDVSVTAPCIGAGNVRCDDPIDVNDAILILKFAAGLLPKLPAPCPAVGATVRGHIISSGSGTLHGTYDFDFDTGSEASGTTDVFWDQSTEVLRYLQPQNGATLAYLGMEDFDGLGFKDEFFTIYSLHEINGSDNSDNHLSAGTVFAVHTSDGNYAKVKVVSYGYNLSLQWVTYQPVVQ